MQHLSPAGHPEGDDPAPLVTRFTSPAWHGRCTSPRREPASATSRCRRPARIEDGRMLHRSLSPAATPRGGASSLLRQGLGNPVTPLPTLRAQRQFVLARQAFVPQQLSLFGPPGGGR